ncbi:MAG: ribonuclease P protein component [Chloroflexota bacterium]
MRPVQRASHPSIRHPWGQDRRLRKRADFQVLLSEGKSWANRLLVLKARPNGMSTSRVGFSISKRVGNAVIRNRVKRRLREVVRQADLQDGWDLVFIARGPAAQADFSQAQGAAYELLRRARVLCDDRKESE